MLAKDSIYNILGYAIPSVIALPAMGILARCIGTEQFGIFLIIFGVIGYASIFDLGLSRASIRLIARNEGSHGAIWQIVKISSLLTFILSVFIALIAYIFSRELCDLLNVSASYKDATQQSIILAALAIPGTMLSANFFSYLEGIGSFKKLNVYRCVGNAINVVMPTLLVLAWPSLVAAMAGVLIAKMVFMFMAWSTIRKVEWKEKTRSKNILVDLLKYGGWLSISNIVTPLVGYSDRFYISNKLGGLDVGIYAPPADLIGRFSIIPSAISRALFPRLAKVDGIEYRDLRKVMAVVFTICMIIALPTGIFANEILKAWLGSSYQSESTNLLRVILIGFVLNSIAQVPFTYIQAKNKTKTTAFIHIFEIVPYLLALVYLVDNFGLMGAAYAFNFRVAVDFIALHILAVKLDRVEFDKVEIVK